MSYVQQLQKKLQVSVWEKLFGGRCVIKLYHFTSIENMQKIFEVSKIHPMSEHNGQQITWLTKVKEKHRQYWAVGEHKDKTQVRFTLSTLNFSKLQLPGNAEDRQELFRVGAVERSLWIEDNSQEKPNAMNWYTSFADKKLSFEKAEVFYDNLGKYVCYAPEATYEELREDARYRIRKYGWHDWYKLRWTEYYTKKYNL